MGFALGFLLTAALSGSVASALSWTLVTVDAGSGRGGYNSLELRPDAFPAISYIDANGDTMRYAFWNGASWTVQVAGGFGVSPQGDVNVAQTSLAFAPDGTPRIAFSGYIGFNTSTPYDLRYSTYSGSWSTQTASTGAPSNGTGQGASLAIGTDGKPQISHYNAQTNKVAYATFNGSSWSSQDVVSGDRWTSLALDANNNPRIAYRDGFRASYAALNNGVWTTQLIDSSAFSTGMYISLRLNAAGLPRVAYYQDNTGDLRYASYDGSTWTVTTVDSVGNVGANTSLVLDSAGNPHISYQDVGNGDLKYAYFNGTSWSVETVDAANYTGTGTSIELFNGLPRISYYTETGTPGLRFAYVGAIAPEPSLLLPAAVTALLRRRRR